MSAIVRIQKVDRGHTRSFYLNFPAALADVMQVEKGKTMSIPTSQIPTSPSSNPTSQRSQEMTTALVEAAENSRTVAKEQPSSRRKTRYSQGMCINVFYEFNRTQNHVQRISVGAHAWPGPFPHDNRWSLAGDVHVRSGSRGAGNCGP